MTVKSLLKPHLLAMGLLATMAGFLFYAAWHDSATMDEVAHIPAGYSYVVTRDMRLNPEHPPLVKTLSGLAVFLAARSHFPEDLTSWQTGINDQWSFGFDFLYRSGNDAEKIIHAARIPAIILTLLLGWFIWLWGKELMGPRWALLPMALYTFSPNFVAHGHLVTTDIGAALGVLVSLYYFTRFLRAQTPKNLLLAGMALGIGLLLKFTVAIVVPIIVFLGILYALSTRGLREILPTIGKIALIGIVSVTVVTAVYLFHVWNYPPERQAQDINFILEGFGSRTLVQFVVWLTDKPVLRAFSQYLFGFFMNLQRASGGNTAYFLGEISNTGWWYYFPMVYLLKEPIPILTLIAIALFLALRGLADRHFIGSLREKLQQYPGETVMLLFITIFWASSISSTLNIGVRHIFPTLPLIYLLATKGIRGWTRTTIQDVKVSTLKIALVGTAVIWLVAEFLWINPYFLAYFNEFAGGPAKGVHYVVDSNLDWGQDLKRLRDFVLKNGITKIKVDYFGGGNAEYYLGERYERLERGPQKGWIAVSASFLKSGQGKLNLGLEDEEGFYLWLNAYKPVAKIGYSIYVYRIPE